ncbi:DNA repair protein RecO [Solitalea koreensis]|uniref:DNA repair protein RecO n=1 Tax=Solitalea koreensis TaxID=543615 RepID=A0A521AS64_9SPHI|nr:DNA repair protein RecO [Solitalea koreensis]SMO37673.1 DNA replication and repair protein RecO [Solitalea koreensis]
MLQKTRGIVLKTTNYSESSIVAQIFTEKFGVQSYMVNGVRKTKAKNSANLFQPLNLLELVVYNKASGGIQRISEIRNTPVYMNIPFDIVKGSLLMFLNEMIYKSFKQETEDSQLFEFVFNSIQFLDLYQGNPANFHLLFLIRLSKYLGFYPDNSYAATSHYFDLKNGVFLKSQPLHPQYISQPYSNFVAQLLNIHFEDLENLTINAAQRKVLLQALIDFYHLHIDGMGIIYSHEVLEEILR